MRYPVPLVQARLIRRYKRFLCDVELPGGEVVIAHLANPGSMKTCLEPDAAVRLALSADPKRKLPWGVEQIRVDGTWIVVNTARPNVVVGEALAAGAIPELAGYPLVEREKPFVDSGRVDWLLSDGDRKAYVEVKNATMREGDRAVFPDTRSERALRHLDELRSVVRSGARGVLLFHVGRGDATAVAPADTIDPDYGRALRRAAGEGVEVLAYRCVVAADALRLGERLPVML